jgi:hypothetical protein
MISNSVSVNNFLIIGNKSKENEGSLKLTNS